MRLLVLLPLTMGALVWATGFFATGMTRRAYVTHGVTSAETERLLRQMDLQLIMIAVIAGILAFGIAFGVTTPLRAFADRLAAVKSGDLRAPLILSGIGQLRIEPIRGEGLSWERLNGKPLHIRLRSGGETLMLPGRAHHHALKKLLQTEGVPPWLRARLPLFYADHELAAVADRWVCAPFLAADAEEGLKIVWEPFVGTVGAAEKARY